MKKFIITMKGTILLIFFVLSFFALGATVLIKKANEYATLKEKEAQAQANRLAITENIEGVYVFILSVPNADYERLGTVEKHFALTGSNSEMITSLVKKAKKEYSQCQAIIFTGFVFEKCEVIKFKNENK